MTSGPPRPVRVYPRTVKEGVLLILDQPRPPSAYPAQPCPLQPSPGQISNELNQNSVVVVVVEAVFVVVVVFVVVLFYRNACSS